MATQNSRSRNQTFAYLSPNGGPPIENFEQWAQLVKSQMLESLHRRSKSLVDER